MSEIIAPVYEFLLWNNCNNNCKFCHQKANKEKYPNKFLNDAGRMKSIKLVHEFISEGKLPEGSNVLFMGGELFDNELPSVLEENLLGLVHLIVSLMRFNRVGLFYMNSNLIYENTHLLFKFCDILTEAGMDERVRFTTSYDLAYRYATNDSRTLMERNMIVFNKSYPKFNKVANLIMTDVAVDGLLAYPQYLSSFKETYGFELIPFPYIILHEEMAATRGDIQNLLFKLNSTYPGFLDKYVKNVSLPQEKVIWEFNGTELVYQTAKDAECGHNENFRRVYKDDNRCFICDCLSLNQLVNP